VNKEIAFKWAEALRTWPNLQTRDVLAEEGGYCALGMLCKIYCEDVKDIAGRCPNGITIGFWDRSENSPNRTAVFQTFAVPTDVMLWAGIGGLACSIISEMNDGCGAYAGNPWDFTKLADYIETKAETL